MIMFNVQCTIVLKTEAFALGGTYPSHVNKDKKFFPYEDAEVFTPMRIYL